MSNIEMPASPLDESSVLRPISGKHPRMWFRNAGACEGPDCKNVVPAGMVFSHQIHWFCADDCKRRARNLRRMEYKRNHGNCEFCQQPILNISYTPLRFCCKAHYRASERKRIMSPAGPLEPILEDYILHTSHYADSTLPCVKTNLARFARYIYGELGIALFESVRPSTISKYMEREKKRGIKSTNTIGHLSTFFNWLIVEKDLDIRNPVIRLFHKQRSRQNDPRPLGDQEVSSLWEILVDHGHIPMMLAFAIGEECGLRGGETCNIRLQDVDTVRRTIFVRRPTKNDIERTVPYHDKVARCLDLWMPLRNPGCGHDHLLHGERNAPWHIWKLDQVFKRVFTQMPRGADKFVYHRLRHTWASRLVNGGMDVMVLQKLGGWLCLATLKVYVRVKPEAIDRQYRQAYEQLKLRRREPSEEIMLMDKFVAMEIGSTAIDS
jgi:integrase